MTRPVAGGRHSLEGLGWERIMGMARRWGLPVVALGSLLSGLTILFDPFVSVGAYVPFALFGAGLAVLVVFPWYRLRAIDDPDAMDRTTKPAAGPTSPTTRSRVTATASRGVVRPSRAAEGSEWRVLELGSSMFPDHESGLSWLTPARERPDPIGSTLSSGVIRSPGKAGNLFAFPVRNYIRGVRTAMSAVAHPRPAPRPAPNPNRVAEPVPSLAGPASGEPGPEAPPLLPKMDPFSEEELDRLFPLPSKEGPVFLDGIPERIGRPASRTLPWEPEDEGVRRSAGEEPPPDLDIAFDDVGVPPRSIPSAKGAADQVVARPTPPMTPELDELFREASNPVPPELRGAGSLFRFDPPAGSHARRAGRPPRTVCASCSKVVLNLRMSGPCPRCLRPICHECLRNAIATQGHGWCVDCAPTEAAVSAN